MSSHEARGVATPGFWRFAATDVEFAEADGVGILWFRVRVPAAPINAGNGLRRFGSVV